MTATRVLGVRRGLPVGILSVDLGGCLVQVRQELAATPGERVAVQLDPGRLLAFRDGWRVAEIGAGSEPEAGA